MSKSVLFL